jgi:hypothetical protein
VAPEVEVRSSKSVKSMPSAAPRRLRAAAATAAVTAGLVLAAPASAMAAGTVTPSASCYWANSDGSFTVSVGYNNTGATVSYPVGPLNYVTPSPQDRGQPTTFLAGNHQNIWAPTIPATDFSGGANWVVNGVSVDVSTFTACSSKPVNVSGSTSGYLGATGAVVGIGLYILKSPRRRRALAPRRQAKATVSA